jgi:hypothetical protein
VPDTHQIATRRIPGRAPLPEVRGALLMAHENDIATRENDASDGSMQERASRTVSESPRDVPAARVSGLATRVLSSTIAAIFTFSFLAKSGIGDPYDRDVADLACRIAARVFPATALEIPHAVILRSTLTFANDDVIRGGVCG